MIWYDNSSLTWSSLPRSPDTDFIQHFFYWKNSVAKCDVQEVSRSTNILTKVHPSLINLWILLDQFRSCITHKCLRTILRNNYKLNIKRFNFATIFPYLFNSGFNVWCDMPCELFDPNFCALKGWNNFKFNVIKEGYKETWIGSFPRKKTWNFIFWC